MREVDQTGTVNDSYSHSCFLARLESNSIPNMEAKVARGISQKQIIEGR